MRSDIASMRVEIIRWSFLFWITQLGAMAGLLAVHEIGLACAVHETGRP